MKNVRVAVAAIGALCRVMGRNLCGQQPVTGGANGWTAAQDHQNMMEQLGIKALRPGPSGNETAPNHANYDESTANPYPNLPDVLKLKNGKKVTTAKQWWEQRRPEIVEDFDREVLGRVPKNVPKVKWTVANTVNTTLGTRGGGREAAGGTRGFVGVPGDSGGNTDAGGDAGRREGSGAGDDDVRGTWATAIRSAAGGRGRAGARRAGRPGWIWTSAGRRSAGDGTIDCRRVGIRDDQSGEHSGG